MHLRWVSTTVGGAKSQHTLGLAARYYHTDHLGSPIAATNTTGRLIATGAHHPYGALPTALFGTAHQAAATKATKAGTAHQGHRQGRAAKAGTAKASGRAGRAASGRAVSPVQPVRSR